MSNEAYELEYEKFLEREADKVEKIHGTIYLPLGNREFAIIDSDCSPEILSSKWCVVNRDSGKHAARNLPRISGKRSQKKRYLHHAVVFSDVLIDHKNGDGLDNRRENLRPATILENNRGFRKKSRRATSIYRGVCREKKSRQWKAAIGVNGVPIYLGLFKDEIEAARAYDTAAHKYFGEFAAPNFP